MEELCQKVPRACSATSPVVPLVMGRRGELPGSNKKRAKKFENEVQIDLPLNFREKGVLLQAKIIAGCVRSSIMEGHVATWKMKPQHGAFFRKLESVVGIDMKASVSWLSTCHLAPHSESYILAAQEMALIT